MDSYEVPGTALSAKTLEKASGPGGKIDTPNSSDKSLSQLGSDIYHAAEWHINSVSDEHTSSKYGTDPDVKYYGNGALSMLGRAGTFVFSKTTREANQAAFKLDQSNSSFYSSMTTTTVGSLDIQTVDGWLANPISHLIPSTNFSPNKPWIKKLFPTLTNRELMMVTVLELVQYSLTKILKGQEKKPTSSSSSRKDMTQIIVDNQDSENQLFNTIFN